MIQREKIAVITGATGGIGTQVCRYLLRNNYLVFAACRNMAKGEKMKKEIESGSTPNDNSDRLILMPIDMCSLNSVDQFISLVTEHLARLNRKIDVLINNAGIIAPKFAMTIDGHETSLQTNYLAPRRLTEALIAHLNPDGAKIINTISCTIHIADHADPDQKSIEQQKREFVNLKNYGNSKRLLALYTIELHNRLEGVLACAVDPGVVDTGIITMHRWYDPLANIFFRPFIKSAAKGAIPLIHAIEYQCYTSPTPLLFKGRKVCCFPKKSL